MNLDIRNFIEAVKGVELAKRQLAIEEGELKLAREALTKAFFGPDGKAGGDIPESFAIMYEGIPYLIQIDTEGDHGHTIKRIGAIIEAETVNGTAYGPGTTCKCGHLNSYHDSDGCGLCECQKFTWVGSELV